MSFILQFDFRLWLTSKPSLSERMAMMKVLFVALSDCGFEPPTKITMLSEVIFVDLTKSDLYSKYSGSSRDYYLYLLVKCIHMFDVFRFI